MKGYAEIICMGGAFRVYGNTTTVAEFNIYVDPHAAQLVLDSGIPVLFVPLDVTEQVCLDMGHITRSIHPLGTRVSEFICDLTEGYIRYHMDTEGFPGCYLHYPLAVGVAIDRSLCGVRDGFVQVEVLGSVTSGMTVCDFRPRPVPANPANARICMEVDPNRFLDLFLSRVAM
jgi:purine nucleosidase/pyrimidine-specific ribonucleoside hydrolase